MSVALSELKTPIHERDHIRGRTDAPVVIVEYGDYECPHCGRAYWAVKEVLEEFADEVAFVYRNFPLVHEHPRAEVVAEALEAAGLQGRFWEAHDWFYEHQHSLEVTDLDRHAIELRLDVDGWNDDLRARIALDKVRADKESGDQSGVTWTPTFFVNGVKLDGVPDAAALRAAIKEALQND